MTQATKPNAAQLARKEIMLIQMGKTYLMKHHGLDETSYRALLAAKSGGKTSSKDLTWQERKAVLDHMRACGFKVIRKDGRKDLGRNEDQMSKLRAMWHQLVEVGAVERLHDLSAVDAAIEAWAVRMLAGRVDSLRFASSAQLNRLIEAMKKWCLRVGVDLDAAPTNELKGL